MAETFMTLEERAFAIATSAVGHPHTLNHIQLKRHKELCSLAVEHIAAAVNEAQAEMLEQIKKSVNRARPLD